VTPPTAYWADHAWLGGDAVSPGVLIEVEGERIAAVRAGVERPAGAEGLRGLTLPGLANTHSHAFQRALRGRTHRAGGSFWTWREDMYAVAGRLEPDSCYALARAVYAEMALAGVACVGEFHYLHHGPGGIPYANPNALGEAHIAAAAAAGIRITLLDACYLAGGIGTALRGAQLRFGDADADAWGARAAALRETPVARVGAAIHSVRAVPADQLAAVAGWARDRAAPLHVHVSEQVAENEACQQAYGVTPTRLLAAHGLLRPTTTLVHATHLAPADIALVGEAGAYVDFCPTTERDLGDGIGPSRLLADAGARLTLGSDSHAVIDLFEEMRAVELDERLAAMRRGHWSAAELLTAATATGHASLGWPHAGSIAVGQRADLVTLDLASPRTAGAGTDEHAVVFAASAADVVQVIADGRLVHTRDQVVDIGRDLDRAIRAVHG
jgi:formiminoglutamate deiminase